MAPSLLHSFPFFIQQAELSFEEQRLKQLAGTWKHAFDLKIIRKNRQVIVDVICLQLIDLCSNTDD
jgi:hypothetical protein